MAEKGMEGSGTSPFDDLWDEIGKLHKKVTHLQNNRQPTSPLYNFTSGAPGDLPDDPVEGQFAIDVSTDAGYIYSNGAWHLVGGGDAYPINEDAGVLHSAVDGYSGNWDVVGTVDSSCLYNGYLPSDGTQGAYITFRFMLGPQWSLHEWSILYRTSSDHGVAHFYLASIPEDDPTAGLLTNNDGVLKDISTLNFIELPTVVNGYSAGLTRNVHSYVGDLRIMGAPGEQFTSFDNTDPSISGVRIDGGPGPYAVKLQIDDKSGSSSGYKFDLQALQRKRVDWAFG